MVADNERTGHDRDEGGPADRRREKARRTVGGGYLGQVSGMRVLAIEDHEDLAGVLARGLRRDGMAVDVALDGGEGWFRRPGR